MAAEMSRNLKYLVSTPRFNLISEEINLDGKYWNQILVYDFAMLCTIVQRLLSPKMDEAGNRNLRDVISRCRQLNDHRLRIVHGQWRIGRRSAKLTHSSRQQLEAKEYYHNPDELLKLCDQASHLQGDLNRIAAEVFPA